MLKCQCCRTFLHNKAPSGGLIASPQHMIPGFPKHDFQYCIDINCSYIQCSVHLFRGPWLNSGRNRARLRDYLLFWGNLGASCENVTPKLLSAWVPCYTTMVEITEFWSENHDAFSLKRLISSLHF